MATAHSNRQPELASSIPGAGDAQPRGRRPLRVLPVVAQGATLVFGFHRRRWRCGLIALATRLPSPGLAGLAALLLSAAVLFAVVPQVWVSCGFVVYFSVINAASLAGVFRGTFGTVSGVWTTPRQEPVSIGRVLRPGLLVLGGAFAGILYAALVLGVDETSAAPAVFRSAMTVLLYVYVGYPIVLSLLARFAKRLIAVATHNTN